MSQSNQRFHDLDQINEWMTLQCKSSCWIVSEKGISMARNDDHIEKAAATGNCFIPLNRLYLLWARLQHQYQSKGESSCQR